MIFWNWWRQWFGKPKFDFGTGKGSLQRVLDAVNTALRAGDEMQLRALWEHLEATVPRDASETLEANKPIYAGRVLGEFLNSKHRYAEAETVLQRVKMRKKAALTELLAARFALADAIWSQGDRERAERDALQWIEKLLAGRESMWPLSESWAKLGKYRYDFEAQAHHSEKAFAGSADEKLAALIETNRQNAKLHLQTALAWHDAGRNSPALEHLGAVYASNPTEEQRLMTLNLEFFWRAGRGEDERVAAILIEAQNVAQTANSPALLRRWTRMSAHAAQASGDLDGCEAHLNVLGEEMGADDAQQTLTARAETLVLRGEWDNARRLYHQKARLHPTSTRYGARYRALTALGVAFLELRAHYCGDAAFLPAAQAGLERAALALRGDRKLLLWMEAVGAALAAAQNRTDEALQRARALKAQWDTWNDSPDTQNTLAPLLMGVYYYAGHAEKAIFWGERTLEISRKPVYRMSHAQMLARAYNAQGNTVRARELREMVAQSGLPTIAVALAKRELEESS